MQRLAAIREGGGAVKPSIDVAMKAANFFGISIAYMTGSRPPQLLSAWLPSEACRMKTRSISYLPWML